MQIANSRRARLERVSPVKDCDQHNGALAATNSRSNNCIAFSEKLYGSLLAGFCKTD
jgi:uncharacterized protein YerC